MQEEIPWGSLLREGMVAAMDYSAPSKCPVCGGELRITKLTCPHCSSEVTGGFTPCRYCSLNDKLRLFLETFLKCRGNIRDVEKALSVSYPTVKGLLEELLSELYPEEKTGTQPPPDSAHILDLLEKGEITAARAAELLSGNQ